MGRFRFMLVSAFHIMMQAIHLPFRDIGALKHHRIWVNPADGECYFSSSPASILSTYEANFCDKKLLANYRAK